MSAVDSSQIGALIALINQDRAVEAERRARSMLADRPGTGVLWKVLSVALARQGKDALAELGKAAQLLPQDAEAQRNLGAALYDRGQWSAALTSFDRSLAIQPNDAEALVDAANALRALGRAQESVPLYQKALSLNPRHLEAQNNLGNAFLELGQPHDAVSAYRHALSVRAHDPQIMCNLGNALRLAGQWEEAAAAAGRAVELDKNSSVAHHHLGLALAALGQRAEAVACYRQALAISPDHVDALVNLGDALRDLGQRREAVPLYRKAIQLDPRRAEIYCQLGTLLFELRRAEEAVGCFQQALALKRDYAPAHLSLGFVYRQQRRPDAAETSCRTALAHDPAYVDALTFLGELFADRGQFADAERMFERAIAINPDYAPAYAGIATHRKMTSGDAAWVQRAAEILGKRPPLAHEIGLQYALGKYHDDIGQYGAAFEHYRRANELAKRSGSVYEREKLTERVTTIMRSFDSGFIRQLAGQTSNSDVPLFILGMPRSGTSLAEQILASHPAVFGAGEVSFWNAAYDRYRNSELKNQADARLIADMAAHYLARLRGPAATVPRVIDKMPANFLYAGLIHAALPRARIIHMQRHPIDTCLSIYFQNFFNIGPYAHDLNDLAHYYREYRRITDHWRTVLPASALLEVPYESLIREPETWSRRMVEFAGLPWDPKCLDFHQTDRVVITASKWQVRQKISTASAGRWLNYAPFIEPLRPLLEFVAPD